MQRSWQIHLRLDRQLEGRNAPVRPLGCHEHHLRQARPMEGHQERGKKGRCIEAWLMLGCGKPSSRSQAYARHVYIALHPDEELAIQIRACRGCCQIFALLGS